MANKLEKGTLVFVKDQKIKGKLYSTKGSKAVVEVIVNYDKETGQRTTKLIETDIKNLTLYRERKKKRQQRKKDVRWRRTHSCIDATPAGFRGTGRTSHPGTFSREQVHA